MPSRGQPITLTYVAWDNTANAGKTGDVANHTLRWIKDGVAAAPTNAPAEVDATNAPGVCKVDLTAAECTAHFGTLAGKSSTGGVAIIGASVTFEQLPTAAAGAANGLPTLDDQGAKTGYKLASDGLDQISIVDPGGVSGHTSFPKILVALYRRWFRKTDVNGNQLRTYADDGTTVNTTQPVSDNGTTQTVGAAQ